MRNYYYSKKADPTGRTRISAPPKPETEEVVGEWSSELLGEPEANPEAIVDLNNVNWELLMNGETAASPELAAEPESQAEFAATLPGDMQE